jgi:cytochrome b
MSSRSSTGESPKRIRAAATVWDLPVRVTHWALAIAVVGSWLSHYGGTRWFAVHRYCGYTVLVLVAFRVAWGFVGTRHAKFRAFLSGPRRVREYLRGGWRDVQAGHNPLGGWSVIAMLGLLGFQATSGLFANDEIASAGPFYGWVSHETSNRLTALHHANADWLLVLLALHALAIVVYEWPLRKKLIGPMITGRKAADSVPENSAIGHSQTLRAIVLVTAIALALAVALRLAPDSVVVLF